MSNDPLDRAIRNALRDIVAAAPGRDDVPVRPDHLRAEGGRHRPLVAVAAGLVAAAGIVAVVAVTTRSTITTDIARSSTPTTAATTTTVAVTSTAAPTPGPLQRVEFRSGTSNASVSGEVVPGMTDRYVLEASAEQRMIVNVDTASEITFSIFAPDGTALAEDEVLAAVDLPADGDYVVEVTTTGAGGEYEIDFLIN
jgi:hypothetical protein